jgi:hypothetical protein
MYIHVHSMFLVVLSKNPFRFFLWFKHGKEIKDKRLIMLHHITCDSHDRIVGQFFIWSKGIYCVRCDWEMV